MDSDTKTMIGLGIFVLCTIGTVITLGAVDTYQSKHPDTDRFPETIIQITGRYEIDGDYFIEGDNTHLYKIHDRVFHFTSLNDNVTIIPSIQKINDKDYWIVIAINGINFEV